MTMNLQIIKKIGDLPLTGIPEMNECLNVFQTQLDPRETIECMTVLRATMVARANLGIKISGMETSGGEDQETLHVGVRSTITRGMAVEHIEGTVLTI